MNFDLELREIKDICGNVIYNRAMDMYLRNKVRSIRVNENSINILSVTAIVQSAYDVNNYKTSVLINNKNLKLYPNCSCEAFSEYHMCKHVGAVLIKLNKEGIRGRGINIPKSGEEELLETYKSTFDKEVRGIEKESLNMDVTLVVEDEHYGSKKKSFYLELKVGTSRLYVVKNIRELMECMYKSGGTINFGKELQYNNTKYMFKDKDQEIMNIIKEVYDLNLEVMNRVYTNRSVFFSGKRVFLSEGQLKNILTIKNRKVINLEYKGEYHKDTTVSLGCIPTSFYMFMKGDNLNIDMNGEVPQVICEDTGLYYLNNTLYLLSEKEKGDFIPLHRAFTKSENNTISFERSSINDVANFILPKLKSISPIVIKDESVKELIKEEPLITEFYLDKDKDTVTCDVKFNYGEESFYYNLKNEKKNIEEENQKSLNEIEAGISKDTSEDILIRDLVKERKIIEKLYGLGFKNRDNNFYIEDEEDLVEFLTYGVEELAEVGDVYYSDSFKEIKILTPKSFNSSIRLNDLDLLELNFNIEGISREELKETLTSIKQKKKYYKLKNGSIIPLQGNEIKDIYSVIDNFDISISKLASGSVEIPKYASLYIDDKINKGALSFITRNKGFKNLIDNIKDVNSNEYRVPEEQESVLRAYQVIGFKWFKTLAQCGFGGILGDEMGLGKTLQAITFINSEKKEGNLKNKALIVCPTSLVYNWVMEFEKFSKELKIVAISGSKGEREVLLEDMEKYDVIITSYALIRRDLGYYEKMKFDICIIDEAQYIKNPTSLNAESVKSIQAKSKFAMTGTPIENSLTELWSIFDFIMPGYLKTHGKFNKNFELPIVKEKDDKALEELLKLIKPFILRRFKRDVALELPPKIEHKIVVDMTSEQKKLYYSYVDAYKEEMEQEIKEKGFNKSRMKILSLITRLRQICCDPASFIENYKGDSGKYNALYDILEEALENNHKVLLFSQFTTILGSIREKLNKKGVNTMYLDGSVPSKDRMNLVREFNEGEPSIFLISLKAGGTGLNLTSADMVIHFDPWWNPAVEEQAVDRAHRIGQKNTVEVIKLIAKGTIEEKIYNIQEKKKEIIEKVIDGEEHTELVLSSISEKELEELFS
ncbi:SNF2 helicase associated domain-containing protein [Clostridium subterminale]|uniref:SNF2 helicase associated domain-containing protein n=2 Tax=Clostridium subterminale TaxID=1550 RepID=A0ABN1KRF8_CLOSU